MGIGADQSQANVGGRQQDAPGAGFGVDKQLSVVGCGCWSMGCGKELFDELFGCGHGDLLGDGGSRATGLLEQVAEVVVGAHQQPAGIEDLVEAVVDAPVPAIWRQVGYGGMAEAPQQPVKQVMDGAPFGHRIVWPVRIDLMEAIAQMLGAAGVGLILKVDLGDGGYGESPLGAGLVPVVPAAIVGHLIKQKRLQHPTGFNGLGQQMVEVAGVLAKEVVVEQLFVFDPLQTDACEGLAWGAAQFGVRDIEGTGEHGLLDSLK